MGITDEDLARARELWAGGRTLGEIADEVGCDLGAISFPLFVESCERARGDGDIELP